VAIPTRNTFKSGRSTAWQSLRTVRAGGRDFVTGSISRPSDPVPEATLTTERGCICPLHPGMGACKQSFTTDTYSKASNSRIRLLGELSDAFFWMANCTHSGGPRTGTRRMSMHSIAWCRHLSFSRSRHLRICAAAVSNWLVLPFMVVGTRSPAAQGWSGIGAKSCRARLGALLLGVLCWLGGMEWET